MASEDCSEWLSQWLKETKLHDYQSKFIEGGVNSKEDFQRLSTEEIMNFVKNDMGVTKTLKVKRIVRAIQDLQASMAPKLMLVPSNKKLLSQIISVQRKGEIERVYQGNKVAVNKSQERFYNIDVEDVMSKLTSCGQLIQLAYANSHGCTCQAKVVVLLSKYQDLTKNSFIGSSRFVDCSLSALQNHKLAYDLLTKSPATSILFLSDCAKMAAAMAKEAENLEEEASKLANFATEALALAVQDQTVSKEKRRKVLEKIHEATQLRAELEEKVEKQELMLQRLLREEQSAIKRAEKETDMKLIGDIIKSIAGAVGGAATTYMNTRNPAAVANAAAQAAHAPPNAAAADNSFLEEEEKKDKEQLQQAQHFTANDRVMLLGQQRYEVERSQIEINANLKKTILELQNQKESNDTIGKALMAIELTIKALGKIKTIFANVRVFWQGVHANCQNLASIGDTLKRFESQAHLCRQQILEQIEKSALSWFTLLKVNYYGNRAIARVDKTMDAILDNLPSESEALNLVDRLAKELKDNLDSEDAKMAKSMAQNKAIALGNAK